MTYNNKAPAPRITKASDKAPTRTKLGEIRSPNVWCMVEGEYTQDWEPRSEKVWQTGLLKDETGQCKVTVFAGQTTQKLEVGKRYRLWSVVTDEYPAGSGRFSVKVNKKTLIEEIE